MRHCIKCKFKYGNWCEFWEELRKDVCLVGCSEKFIQECCDEGIFEICGGFEIIIADYDAFVEKWTKFFEKDKVQARQFLGAAEAKVYAKLIF